MMSEPTWHRREGRTNANYPGPSLLDKVSSHLDKLAISCHTQSALIWGGDVFSSISEILLLRFVPFLFPFSLFPFPPFIPTVGCCHVLQTYTKVCLLKIP